MGVHDRERTPGELLARVARGRSRSASLHLAKAARLHPRELGITYADGPVNLRANHDPDAGALSGPLAGVTFIASLVALNALSEARYPTPGSEPAVVRRFFAKEHKAARLGAAAQLACAACLARFAKSVATLAGRATRESRGLRAASVAGGALASVSLATSALTTVALTTRHADREETADSLYRLMFVTGGPVHGVGLGLLIAALGRAGLRTGELPSRLSKAALASSIAGALSPLALVARPGIAFIPLGRLSALLVIGISGVRLARGAG
jgi:hypothetical protein